MNKAQCNRCYRKNRDCREHIVFNDDYCPSFFYKIDLEKKPGKSTDPLNLKESKNKAKKKKSSSSDSGILSLRNVLVGFLLAVTIFAIYQFTKDTTASSSSAEIFGVDKSGLVVHYKVPPGFTQETKDFSYPDISFQELKLNDTCRLAIFTDVYSASSITKLSDACHLWGSQNSFEYSFEKLSEEKRIINGNRCLCIINRCAYNNSSLFWRQVLVIDKESTRISLVSCYDQGEDSYLLSILNSFSFR